MIKKAYQKKISIKRKIYLLVFTFFFLFVQIIGYHCSKFGSSKLLDIKTYLFVLLVPIFYILFKILFNLFLLKLLFLLNQIV